MELKSPTDTHDCLLYDMAVLPNCNILVADRWNKTVNVVEVETGRLLSYVQLPGSPYRLCLLPGDRFAVSLSGGSVTLIQIIDVSTDHLKLLDSVNVEGCCGGLAYMNNKFIVGLNDQCVASINNEGKLLKSVSKDNTGNELFKNLYYICVTTTKDAPSIYVSDRSTRTITQLSEELEVLQTFKFPTDLGPYGLAAAGGEQLIVTGLGPDNCILWLLDTSTGVFTKLLNKLDVGDWNGRVAICPRMGRVYINARKTGQNENIKVYEIS